MSRLALPESIDEEPLDSSAFWLSGEPSGPGVVFVIVKLVTLVAGGGK